MKNRLYFDIETAPQPLDQLEKAMPEFDAGGTLKDPDKIKAKLVEKREKWIADAALSPVTGQVLCIGLIDANVFRVIAEPTEAETLKYFWDIFESAIGDNCEILGFNIDDFDLPFLYGRSYATAVKIPRVIGGLNYRRWHWNEAIIDLRTIWQLGSRQREGSLDVVSKLCGGGGKNGDGSKFAGLWALNRAEALSYLENDLNQIKIVGEKLL